MEGNLFNVLFLSSGNSSRGLFAESLLNRLGRGKFRAYSAGKHPKKEIHPLAQYELINNNYDLSGLFSKGIEELSSDNTPQFDFVITVSDETTTENWPDWPGQPMIANWGVSDPSEKNGTDIERKAAFHRAFAELENRISIFVNLPFASIDEWKLQEHLDKIGQTMLARPDASSTSAVEEATGSFTNIKKILMALDGSDESFKALDTAIGLSASLNAELALICVATLESLPSSLRGIAELKLSELSHQDQRWPAMTKVPLWLHEAVEVIKTQGTHQRVIDELAAQILEKAQAAAELKGIRAIRLEQGSGPPAEEIVAKCKALEADLVIVAPRHLESGISQDDSVAVAVARSSPCSCLIVK